MPRFDFRFGIAARLATAFITVAVLAVAANLIAEHGPSIIRRTEVRFVTPPVSRASPGKLSAASPATASLNPGKLSAAITQFGMAVRDRAADPGEASALRLDQAERTLAREEAAFFLAARAAGAKGRLRELATALEAQRTRAASVVNAADEVRRIREEYSRRFESLDGRFKGALDRAWKIFGRVVARQSLVETSRILDNMRPGVMELIAPEPLEQHTLTALAADEELLNGIVERNTASLARTQGESWLLQTRDDLAALATNRQALRRTAAEQPAAMAGFASDNGRVMTLVNSIRAPPVVATPRLATDGTPIVSRGPLTRRGPGQAHSTVETIDSTAVDDRRLLMAWLSGGTLLLLLVISVGTVASIVRPVRSLMSATQRLANGERNVTVPRGGTKELDALAVAFNLMAERLIAAQDLARQYHGELEARVEERTRQLQHLAAHDPLTQLPNRRQLMALLSAQLEQAAAGRHLLGIYFLDLDNFKNINDSMGHVFGDRVLQVIARRLESVCASFGYAARLGGDEFTVVFPHASGQDEILAAGRALVEAFHAPLKVDGRELTVSVSAGVGIYPDHELEVEALLRAADAALFRAKALGRRQLSVFSPDLLRVAASRFTTEQGLQRALERDEFELVFQPEVNAETGQVDVVEALVRWRLPNGQCLAPDEFLSIAEDSGLISQISEWIVRSAVATAARWHHSDWPEVRVAINMSARQLLDSNAVETLETLLREYRLPTHCIELELTENVLQTGPNTIEALRRLRAAGFRVALDDFGTGYSSLVSLEQLPLTRVKLDQALIASMDSSARSLAIARAIIGLCEGLGLEVTAEGVERREQLLPLLNHRGMHIQGFLLARPLAAADIPQARAELPARWAAVVSGATEGGAQRSQRIRLASIGTRAPSRAGTIRGV